MPEMRKHAWFSYCVILAVLTGVSSCSGKQSKIIRAVDFQRMKVLVFTGDRADFGKTYDADFVILGGSIGGIAAAIAVCSSGRSAVLIEETDRIAGCFTGVDTLEYFDSRLMETAGFSLRYLLFRERIREWYRTRAIPQPTTFSGHGQADTEGFCFTTEAALDVTGEMLGEQVASGRLTILTRHAVAKVFEFNKRITSLNVVDIDNTAVCQVIGWMFIDATETGDFLDIAGIPYTVGRESALMTGEPHAPAEPDTSGVYERYYYREDPAALDRAGIYEYDLVKAPPAGEGSYSVLEHAVEPRRIKALVRIAEQDISAAAAGGPRAVFYYDSVGIGHGVIRIPGRRSESPEVVPVKPFQIPLRALVTEQYVNFLAGGRIIGATYCASTVYGTPSVVWAVGEGAGEAAALCAGRNITVQEIINSPDELRFLHKLMTGKRGIPLYWYDDVAPGDPDFAEAQMLPFDDPSYNERAKTLHFRN